MTDEDRLADPRPVIPHLPPGSAVIVRHRDAKAAAHMASGLLHLARAHDVLVLLSAHTPPKHLHADGLHIPEAALKSWTATDFARLSPALITSSAHSLNAVMTAERRGVDAVLLSPVFPTRSHEGAVSLGLLRFAAITRHARNAGLPVIALGGITPARTRRTICAGASGIAGIGLFTPDGHSRMHPHPEHRQ
ncbi:MAG: thiamine phosphate synthase [Rhodospirillales bacterium]